MPYNEIFAIDKQNYVKALLVTEAVSTRNGLQFTAYVGMGEFVSNKSGFLPLQLFQRMHCLFALVSLSHYSTG